MIKLGKSQILKEQQIQNQKYKMESKMYVQFLLNFNDGINRSLGATSSTSAATYLPKRQATLLMNASVVRPEGPAMSRVPWPYLVVVREREGESVCQREIETAKRDRERERDSER